MPCLLALAGFFFPRLVIILLAIFDTGYLTRAYSILLWPILGFIFLPFTTLAYALAYNSTSGHITGFYLVLVVLAVLLDLGFFSGQSRSTRRMYTVRRRQVDNLNDR